MKPSCVVLATGNAGKLEEFRALLSGVPLVPPEHHLSPEETGGTYYENALIKALAFQRAHGGAVLSDDSGLEIDALEGQPGVHSARFGGAQLDWPARWAHTHSQLQRSGVEPRRWTARFRCVLCFYDGKTVPRFFEGVAEGRILAEPTGAAGFGYDPIFFSEALQQSFAQAEPVAKNRVSHRGRAVLDFLSWWRSLA